MPFFSTSKAAENPGTLESVQQTPPSLAPPSPTSSTPVYQPRQVLNVPSGNSEISSEPGVVPAEERRTGDMKRDLVEAVKGDESRGTAMASRVVGVFESGVRQLEIAFIRPPVWYNADRE
ncbi:hypothetical protein QFC21_004594 [Naganishia friedmannii]|uniref:Uncharacterized protein n=1 Tax=Naganishia friedmannii TaxID=89922 RepID=A0ACC2VH83_9TREE|nr:hypothetical protein QFC21_004594 [Naganishia friedmannii]